MIYQNSIIHILYILYILCILYSLASYQHYNTRYTNQLIFRATTAPIRGRPNNATGYCGRGGAARGHPWPGTGASFGRCGAACRGQSSARSLGLPMVCFLGSEHWTQTLLVYYLVCIPKVIDKFLSNVLLKIIDNVK